MPEEMGWEAKPGRNPHYKPPIMRWNVVEIEAPPGTSFVVTCDSAGVLGLRMCCKHDAFVEQNLPPNAKVDVIPDGHICWRVKNDERSPAIGHEWVPDPDNPGRCAECGGET